VLRKAAITADGGGAANVAPGAPGMIPEALAHTLQLPWNDVEAVEAAFRDYGDRIAAVILEPVCGNAGVVHPAPDFLPRLAGLTRRHGALLVFDEVITGYRVALGGAQSCCRSRRPDGPVEGARRRLPGRGLRGSREIMAPLARNEAFHAGVFAGNHAAVGAVVAMVGKLLKNPSVYDELESRCAGLERRLAAAFADADRPVRIARADR